MTSAAGGRSERILVQQLIETLGLTSLSQRMIVGIPSRTMRRSRLMSRSIASGLTNREDRVGPVPAPGTRANRAEFRERPRRHPPASETARRGAGTSRRVGVRDRVVLRLIHVR
jgi:hypothetical protein